MSLTKTASMITAVSIASAAAAAPVPAKLQGVWGKDGRCDRPSDRFTITAHRAGWGKGPFDGVSYENVDYGGREKAIYWDEDGVVDNFVLGSSPNVLLHNTQGFHMPGRDVYVRCGQKRVRVRIP